MSISNVWAPDCGFLVTKLLDYYDWDVSNTDYDLILVTKAPHCYGKYNFPKAIEALNDLRVEIERSNQTGKKLVFFSTQSIDENEYDNDDLLKRLSENYITQECENYSILRLPQIIDFKSERSVRSFRSTHFGLKQIRFQYIEVFMEKFLEYIKYKLISIPYEVKDYEDIKPKPTPPDQNQVA